MHTHGLGDLFTDDPGIAAQANTSRRSAAKLAPRLCGHRTCGETFQPRRTSQVYCDSVCSARENDLRKQARK